MNDFIIKLGQAAAHSYLEKKAFSVTEEGHKHDAEKARLKARHAAELMALGEARAGTRFGVDPEPGDKPKSVTRLLRFGANEQYDGHPRYQEYVARQHEKNENAYNPFGGSFTPSKHESKGTALLIGRYKPKKD